MSTWVLLRGLTRETRHWGRFPSILHDAVETDSLLQLDLPGNGALVDQRAPADVASMVGFVRLALSQSSVPGPYRVLAMSLGGMVATAWAQRYPGEIERLVLINTSMRPFSGITERLRPQAWLALLGAARNWRSGREAEAVIHRLTCNNPAGRADDLAAWSAIRASAPVSRANALRQLWAAARFNAGASVPHCATLILSSAADRLVNPVCSARLAAAWGAAHLQHPWAGHDLPHDDPQWTSNAVAAWLPRVDAPDAAGKML
ncbi:alpha/beta fold hydrolase [Paraburkholderia sp. BCC1885]|uniref:alpha/beta fold hydrolase n=1 Tax=Paraburkholderia sp. BCC1885 TaxID=2562669 RepID=UPI0011824FAE|nr:alpha/beta hydrolase [Paraburkholderia sp. BCC1885]